MQVLKLQNALILIPDVYIGELFTVFFETYGCQMNVNDTEIAWTFLKDSGFTKTTDFLEVPNW